MFQDFKAPATLAGAFSFWGLRGLQGGRYWEFPKLSADDLEGVWVAGGLMMP